MNTKKIQEPEPDFDINKIPLKKVDVSDISMVYREFGSGPPLIMINGFGSTMDMWNPPVLKELSKHYHLFIFDNRGIGYSGSSDKEFSIQLFADDTAKFMEALGVHTAHILGLSMGTFVAQELALKNPEKVDKLILLSGNCGGSEAVNMKAEVLEILADKSGTVNECTERMFGVLFPPAWLKKHPNPYQYCPEVHETSNPESIERQYKAIYSWKGTYNRLSEIVCPTLIITGTEDVIVPPENSVILGKEIPYSWIIRFPGGGHGLMYQYPDQLNRVFITFLELSYE